MVRINGEEKAAAGMTVAAYLEAEAFNTARIVVERNGEIVPKDRYGATALEDGDELEIVCFMGGG
ncbi:MAG: sulfur carrier protein ThiS [Kiritimatiellae bacterium]|nr:sulfur carrier protein ThiS [Kiritimatiellia bacterium]